MKCPKCLYIGFETGDRCKNCGYDFSLLSAADEAPAADPPELPLRQAEPALSGALQLSPAFDEVWSASSGPSFDRFRDLPEPDGPAMTLAGPAFVAEPPVAAPKVAAPHGAAMDNAPALPLFAPDSADDEPLVKLPVAPRPPLAVRRTPDAPRLRPNPPAGRSLHEDAVLQFVEEPDRRVLAAGESGDEMYGPAAADFEVPVAAVRRPPFHVEPAGDASPFSKRAVAAIIDHGILFGIDLVVLYFTLRLTDLTFADWRVLPWLPLAAFLLSVKVAYLSAFTTAGGQTIGKMATHIRVVSEDGGGLDPGRALRRAVLGLVSIATAGAPFLTAIADPLRRGVHDRASGTRVVALSPR
ncbi:MAG TPA: RDD family protein [Vicinamibacterales bacterium]|nr:RDD family protein [Vicinamibacterales bacterium]